MDSPKPSRFVGTTLAVTSLASLFAVAFFVVVAAALTPDYSHVSQFISELGATGAPYGRMIRLAAFVPAGVLLIAFSALSYSVLPRSRSVLLSLVGLALFAAGYLVAAAFPCDPGCRPAEPSTSQLIHNAGGLVGYVLAPFFLLALARAVRHWPGATRLAVAGYVASAIALTGLLTLSPESAVVGLSQRALEAAVLVWVALLGIFLARRMANAAE